MKKRINLIVLTLVLSIFLSGCFNFILREETALKKSQELMDEGITYLKNDDGEGIKKVFGDETKLISLKETLISDLFESEQLKEKLSVAYGKVLEKVEVSSLEASKEDDIWEIGYKIRGKDLFNILSTTTREVNEYFLSNIEKLKEGGYGREEIYSYYLDKFIENIEGGDFVESKVSYPFYLESNRYIIRVDDSFIEGIFSGIVNRKEELISNLEEIDGEFEEKIKDHISSLPED